MKVSWDHYSQYDGKVIKVMFQTTKQFLAVGDLSTFCPATDAASNRGPAQQGGGAPKQEGKIIGKP